MSNTSEERMNPCFLVARSLISPEDVVLLMMEDVNSKNSKGSCAAYLMADDLPVKMNKGTLETSMVSRKLKGEKKGSENEV